MFISSSVGTIATRVGARLHLDKKEKVGLSLRL